ncbi:MAG TPA: peptidoglycan DD-metalloendopeptidase family protein [Candidatus Krumholzibacteria bacterium]|nr:peptidoglycan DD-metalloendopeptidase family protein [Candidatus Krumholzibacteria bacterium]HPD72324.1 peptidoglycan DD-metalloendopeptidase family protein [Candidatus Krumholzibacteria bacterium]HRY40744.1 peptidoglycan DD-metalloendopeptidase family protein [Candidatus Krumholzibacteria bacterium]
MRPRPASRRWLVALWLAPALVAAQPRDPAPAQQTAGSAEELRALRAEIAGVRGELAELADRHQDADRSLAQVAREATLVRELLAALDQREVSLATQRDSLQVSLDAQQEIYGLRKQTLAARLRALYELGPHRDLELIVTSESVSTLVARLKFAAILARIDGSLVERTRAQARRIEAEQAQLRSALAGIWEAREEARRERERLEVLEAERRGLLREVTAAQDRTQGELERLRRQEQQLTDLLAQFEARRQEEGETGRTPAQLGVAFADRKGDLPWPADGPVVREFGRSVHPRFGTVTMHNGLSIAASAGAPVTAVAPGQVEFADHLPGFGRCVILDHGAGHYTLYANLAAIFVSRESQVAGGQILAELGDDGESGRPELYFEIREGRDARDPRTWLRPPR